MIFWVLLIYFNCYIIIQHKKVQKALGTRLIDILSYFSKGSSFYHDSLSFLILARIPCLLFHSSQDTLPTLSLHFTSHPVTHPQSSYWIYAVCWYFFWSEREGQGPSTQYLCAMPDWFKYSEIIYMCVHKKTLVYSYNKRII